MTSIFANIALLLLIGSGAWESILLAVVLLLCCGMMMFGMGKHSGRTNKTKQDSDKDHDNDRRSST